MHEFLLASSPTVSTCRPTRFSTSWPWMLSLLLISCIFALVASRDFESMSLEELQNMKLEYTNKLQSIEVETNEITKKAADIRQKKEDLLKEAEKLNGAREWEFNERKKREDELELTEKKVTQTQDDIARTMVYVNEIRKEIEGLQNKMSEIKARTLSYEKKYFEPALSDIVGKAASQWDETPRKVYSKTRSKVLPTVSKFSRTASQYYQKHMSRSAILFVSVILYSFCVLWVLLLWKLFKVLEGKFTVSRLLFVSDSFCSAFWFLILICYPFLGMDPFVAMQTHNETLFFLFQLVCFVTYVGYVLLRLLVLASKMTFSALVELLGVIVIGQHYYIHIWLPSATDGAPIDGQIIYYFCYAWTFAAFSYTRIHEYGPSTANIMGGHDENLADSRSSNYDPEDEEQGPSDANHEN